VDVAFGSRAFFAASLFSANTADAKGGGVYLEYRSNAKLINPTCSLLGMGLTHIPSIKPGWEGTNTAFLTPYHFV
jgi:hypothetical protein